VAIQTEIIRSICVVVVSIGVKAKLLAVGHPPVEAKWTDHDAGLCITTLYSEPQWLTVSLTTYKGEGKVTFSRCLIN
jgi:hypothetical protein